MIGTVHCHQCGKAIRHSIQHNDYLFNKQMTRVVGEFLYTNKNRLRLWIHVGQCIRDYNAGKEILHAKASAKK